MMGPRVAGMAAKRMLAEVEVEAVARRIFGPSLATVPVALLSEVGQVAAADTVQVGQVVASLALQGKSHFLPTLEEAVVLKLLVALTVLAPL